MDKIKKEVINGKEVEIKIKPLSEEDLSAVSGGRGVYTWARYSRCVWPEDCGWESSLFTNPDTSMDQIWQAQKRHTEQTDHTIFEVIETEIKI